MHRWLLPLNDCAERHLLSVREFTAVPVPRSPLAAAALNARCPACPLHRAAALLPHPTNALLLNRVALFVVERILPQGRAGDASPRDRLSLRSHHPHRTTHRRDDRRREPKRPRDLARATTSAHHAPNPSRCESYELVLFLPPSAERTAVCRARMTHRAPDHPARDPRTDPLR